MTAVVLVLVNEGEIAVPYFGTATVITFITVTSSMLY